MSVTLLDIWRAARARSVPFSAESAGYMVLALCEETRGARSLELSDVELMSDGNVRLNAAVACPEAEGEKRLRALLSRLLEVASSPGPSLLRAAGRGGFAGSARLAAELQKALIPFNRAAARRALLRLCRETERAIAEGRLGEPPDPGAERELLPLSPPPEKAVESRTVSPPPPLTQTAPLRLDQLTRPETVVSRRRAGLLSPPPPLLEPVVAPSRAPRVGSPDVAVKTVVRDPQPAVCMPPLSIGDDLTVPMPRVSCLGVEGGAESPALGVGAQVADSDPAAAQVADDEVETRPLAVLAPPMPYEGVPVGPADVRELLSSFQVEAGLQEAELRRELKALAGVDLTPGAPQDVVSR